MMVATKQLQISEDEKKRHLTQNSIEKQEYQSKAEQLQEKLKSIEKNMQHVSTANQSYEHRVAQLESKLAGCQESSQSEIEGYEMKI